MRRVLLPAITEQDMKAAIKNAKEIYQFTEPFINPKETC
jgi:hypothetical protein